MMRACAARRPRLRGVVLALLVLALGLRFAFPPGTMPAAGQWITLCTLDGPVSLMRGADGSLRDDGVHVGVDCPYFFLSGGALAAPDASADWPPRAGAADRPLALPAASERRHATRPPVRGPPSPS